MRRIKELRIQDVEGRSRWFRFSRTASARWFLCVKESWPTTCLDGRLLRSERKALRKQAKKLYKERYGNPLIWMFLLEIMIKAIIWWLQNRKGEE